MSKKNILDALKNHFTPEDYKLALEANGLSNLDKDWTTQLKIICDELQNEKSLLLDQWENLPQSKLDIADFIELADSPLEIIHESLSNEEPILPHPAILILISRQFFYYMLSGGDITLEEAFFGSSKGKGVYANRNKSILFPRFHYLILNKKPRSMTQENYLESLIMSDEAGIASFSSLDIDDIDSFLRKYRRWKNNSLISDK